jgi:hypothetical protein
LEPFESNTERIWDTSMALMAQALEHDPGPHAAWARRLFDELEQARDCLCDPLRKAAYDDNLRQKLFLAEFGAGGQPATGEPPKQVVQDTAVIKRSRKDRTTIERREDIVGQASSPSTAPAPASTSTATASVSGKADGLQGHSAAPVSNPTAEAAKAARPDDDLPFPVAKPMPAMFRSPTENWGIYAAAVAIAVLVVLVAVFFPSTSREVDPAAQFIQQLQSPDPVVREQGARKLHELGPQAFTAMQPLVAALKDGEPKVRLAAAQALLALGPATASLVPELRDRLSMESNPPVKSVIQQIVALHEPSVVMP